MFETTLPATKSKQQVAVVDFSEGHYKFGFHGSHIRQAIYEKTKMMEQAHVDLLETLCRELGTDPREITTLMVSLFENNSNVKVKYIKSICMRCVELGQEIAELKRIAVGMNDSMIYTLGTKELEKFGL